MPSSSLVWSISGAGLSSTPLSSFPHSRPWSPLLHKNKQRFIIVSQWKYRTVSYVSVQSTTSQHWGNISWSHTLRAVGSHWIASEHRELGSKSPDIQVLQSETHPGTLPSPSWHPLSSSSPCTPTDFMLPAAQEWGSTVSITSEASLECPFLLSAPRVTPPTL